MLFSAEPSTDSRLFSDELLEELVELLVEESVLEELLAADRASNRVELEELAALALVESLFELSMLVRAL